MSDENVTISEIGIGVGSAMAGRVIDRKIFETPVTIRADLTRFEQEIFNQLEAAKGEIVSKDDLTAALYSDRENLNPNSNCIEVFVGRLRKKLGDDSITTVRGRGYKMKPLPIVEQTISVAAEEPAIAAAG